MAIGLCLHDRGSFQVAHAPWFQLSVGSGYYFSLIPQAIEVEMGKINFLSFFLNEFICLFLETGEGKEREGEKHQCVVASRAPPAGDLTCNPGMCPDWELNCDPLVPRPALNPLSYTSQGRKIYFYSHTPFFPPLPCPHICQLTFFKVSSFESSMLSCISY